MNPGTIGPALQFSLYGTRIDFTFRCYLYSSWINARLWYAWGGRMVAVETRNLFPLSPFMSFLLDLVMLQSNFQLSLCFLPWTAKRPYLSLSWQNTGSTYFPYNQHVSLWSLIDKSTSFHLSAAPFNLRRSFPALQQPRQHIFSVASDNFNLSCGRLFTRENAKEQCFEKQHAEPGFPWFSTEVCSDSLGMTETRWVNLFPCQHYGLGGA